MSEAKCNAICTIMNKCRRAEKATAETRVIREKWSMWRGVLV